MTAQVDPNRGQALRIALAAKLADDGALHDEQWRNAVEGVPRHLFVPAYWRRGPDDKPQRIDRDDPDRMMGAYEDEDLTVQMTDNVATSSSTSRR
ncbi:hypothetical protein [Actinacidiphila soli]|uniref:hypothetical protein n=1 Tax=Actinacidiphila soli TaxID=2487275 RepID=UPI000FCA8271|nr:hypothetical protein [Actinacidiphila soli]